MSLRLEEPSPEVVAIAADIESVLVERAFFQDVLYPYAIERLPAWLERHADDPQLSPVFDAVRIAAGERDADRARLSRILSNRMGDPNPAPALKTLHSLIWHETLADHDSEVPVHEDAAAAMQYWVDDRRTLFVHSPITASAQKTLFAHTDRGDLSDLCAGYFDLGMGPPNREQTFQALATVFGEAPATLLMLADDGDTLDAAAKAGWQTCWVARDDESQARAEAHAGHPIVATLGDIELV